MLLMSQRVNRPVQCHKLTHHYINQPPMSCSRPVVNLIKGRVVNVQVKAAAALEALPQENPASQKAFLDLDAPKAIMRLFIKVNTRHIHQFVSVAVKVNSEKVITCMCYLSYRFYTIGLSIDDVF